MSQSHTTTLIYKPAQPLATIKRHLVVVPDKAEKEVGFTLWVAKIWQVANNTGAKIVFYASGQTLSALKEIYAKRPIAAEFVEFGDWEDFLIVFRDIRKDDDLWIVLSRREGPSYHANMGRVPGYLNKYFQENSFVLIYPSQAMEISHNRYFI